MTIVVSIADFRKNIADYLSKVQTGHTIVLKDEKRGREIAQLTAKKQFDPEAFGRVLKSAVGVLSAKNHPEWRTKKDVIDWVTKGRLLSDRTF